ncbi:MAG: response regulator [Chitinivibrionales bacterium]|nr:response regulator [Chitinivibrionales bacterium]
MNKQSPTILLIDDNNDTLDLLELYLYKHYEIITAQNGFEGITMAQTHKPSCIITDITMPVMDGIKFFNMLKKNKDIAHVPIIAVTSFIQKLNAKSLLNIGFSDVITKPFNQTEVLDSVKRVLDIQKQNPHENHQE